MIKAKAIQVGPLAIPAAEYGIQASAILGIKESGKSYLGTLLGEELHEAGIPFIAFDPVGVWHNLRRPRGGRGGKGFPIVVAGGDDGDLPLNPATAPMIVEAAMREGVSLVIDLAALSKSDWRTIVRDCVRLLLQKNKPHGLRHVFLEEAAEFVPQTVYDGQVFAEVEKLVRIGGNMRLGVTMISPRAQEINKAVLEMCEHLFLFRQRGKNAIQSLSKWFEVAGVDGKLETEIAKSLPELGKGQCWAWIGGDNPRPPKLIQVQRKRSFHPNRRMTRDDMSAEAPKAINVSGFVEALQGALPALEAEAENADPKRLRAKIVELEKKLAKLPADGASPAELMKARLAGDAEGFERGRDIGRRTGLVEGLRSAAEAIQAAARTADVHLPKEVTKLPPLPVAPKAAKPTASAMPPGVVNGYRDTMHDAAKAGVSKAEFAILGALAFWEALNIPRPSNPQVASVAGYSVTSSSYTNARGALKSAGLVTYPNQGEVELTSEGRSKAPPPMRAQPLIA